MKEIGHDRVWAVGSLLPSDIDNHNTTHRGGSTTHLEVLKWLDGMANGSVIYVCFGSQTSLSTEESAVLAMALQFSNVHFVCCVPNSDSEQATLPNRDFEKQMASKGLLIRGWAPQLAILRHRAVGAFVTHCGWNSVLQSISSGVIMLAWPMGADQYLNAQLVVEQLCLGLRVQCFGSNGVPNHDELAQLLADSVSPTRPEKVQAMKMCEVVASTLSGGNSTTDLDNFVERLSELNK